MLNSSQGEKNELTIYVYSVDSEFAQVFDQRMGCIRAASSQDSIGTRIHMCTPQAGGAAVADSDNESVCSSSADSISGPKAGLCKETCGGKKITIANVLYGLHQLGELVVKSCGDAIFEVGKGL